MRVFAMMIGVACLTLPVATQLLSQETTRKKKAATTIAEKEADKVPKVTAEQPISFWMEKKLDFSKSILESLTKGDFKQLALDAEQMRLLGKIEGFVRRKNESYRTQLRTFDSANLELVRQANRGNAEGAALAFNQLTTSCVACHVLLREGVE